MSQVAKQCLPCRRKRVDAACEHCGSLFQHKPSRPRSACSAACAYALRGRASGAAQSRKVDLVCQWCSSVKRVSPTYAERQYCSRACTALARSGELNPAWKGGVTTEHQSFYAGAEWRRVCAAIYRRDRGLCHVCGERPERGEVHHIEPWALRPDLRLDHSNLVLLCRPCHCWVHSRDNTFGVLLVRD